MTNLSYDKLDDRMEVEDGSSLGEYDGPDESVPEGVVGLADAEGEEAVVALDPARADPHRVPADLVQHHPDPVHLWDC